MDLYDSKYYRNRELSWLDFNERIICEARNSSNPLMERCKFLGIAANNLDEFLMVRLAGITQSLMKGHQRIDVAGLDIEEQFMLVFQRCMQIMENMDELFTEQLFQELNKEKLYFTNMDQLNGGQLDSMYQYYKEIIEPLLNVSAVDFYHPFPKIKNKSLNLVVLLKKDNLYDYALIEIPTLLSRYIELPKMILNERCFVFLEDLIMHHLQELFASYEVVDCACFRVLRDAHFHVDDSKELVDEVKKLVKKRETSPVICLEVMDDINADLLLFLKDQLAVDNRAIIRCQGRLDYTFLMKFYHKAPQLQFEKFIPKQPYEGNLFSQIKQHDLFLHLPYESFQPVIDFLNQAAIDPHVVQIKQTLYRVSEHSPIIEALEKAAMNGKQVSVFVELKARFDEKIIASGQKNYKKQDAMLFMACQV